jgi:hypothetical protein
MASSPGGPGRCSIADAAKKKLTGLTYAEPVKVRQDFRMPGRPPATAYPVGDAEHATLEIKSESPLDRENIIGYKSTEKLRRGIPCDFVFPGSWWSSRL